MQRNGVDKLQSALTEAFRKKEPDLSLRQLAILIHVAKRGRVSIGDISDELFIPKPSVSRAVDRLEELRFCGREVSPEDRRIIVAVSQLLGYRYLDRLEKSLQ